jgi:DNA-binding IclR family transcriptional regulator
VKQSQGSHGVQYVRRIAAILDAFRQNRVGLGVSEVSRITGIHKSTASRMLAALHDEQLVSYDAQSRRYRLGAGIISMAAAAEPDLFLQHVARPYLLQLNGSTGETATLSVLDDYEVLTIDEVSGPSAIRFVAWTGMRTPLHATATGRCLLAFSDPGLLENYLRTHTLHACTPKTITDPDELRRMIERIRQTGYSEVTGELEEGLVAISAPIRDFRGRLLGVMNVTWPEFRVTATEQQQFVTMLLAAARDISALFGHTPEQQPAGPILA